MKTRVRIRAIFFALCLLHFFSVSLFAEGDLEKTIPNLVQHLRGDYMQVYKDRVKKRLVKFGSKAVPYLAPYLNENEEPQVASNILEIFEEIGDPDSAKEVIRFLDNNESVDLTCRGIKTLGKLKSYSAVPKLITLLQEAPDTYFFQEDSIKVIDSVLQAMIEIRAPAFTRAVLDFARDHPQPQYLVRVAYVLGKIGDRDARDFLLDMLKNNDADVRLVSVQALETFLEPSMSGILWIVYDNENNYEIKKAIVDLIVKIAKENDVKRFAAKLKSGENFESQQLSEQALTKMGDRAVPWIVSSLTGKEDMEQTIHLISVLSNICSEACIPYLVEIGHEKNRLVQLAAIDALGKCGDESALSFLTRLEFTFKKEVRRNAQAAIEKITLRSERKNQDQNHP